eukprot:TRINITY_DN115165_c0_g1_i1.p1 TRINITY_DN115165_c0_g1~~TRINITY_DN115165_c0_g1_i1.p1  ORF type:complete len:278 (-),score=21.17 TRINITY_DN115165_c0_g1_i1:318-1151(-)
MNSISNDVLGVVWCYLQDVDAQSLTNVCTRFRTTFQPWWYQTNCGGKLTTETRVICLKLPQDSAFVFTNNLMNNVHRVSICFHTLKRDTNPLGSYFPISHFGDSPDRCSCERLTKLLSVLHSCHTALAPRIQYLTEKIHKELEGAKKVVGINKSKALAHLKRKRMYTQQQEKLLEKQESLSISKNYLYKNGTMQLTLNPRCRITVKMIQEEVHMLQEKLDIKDPPETVDELEDALLEFPELIPDLTERMQLVGPPPDLFVPTDDLEDLAALDVEMGS